ncbi:MAG: hypothetical protein ACRDTZ_09100 [Pseudonocardiaceae bacterium]
MKRLTVLGALAGLIGIVGAPVAAAQGGGAVGPECNPTTGTFVLAAVAGLALPPGTKVQYVEVRLNGARVPELSPCVVTVIG